MKTTTGLIWLVIFQNVISFGYAFDVPVLRLLGALMTMALCGVLAVERARVRRQVKR